MSKSASVVHDAVRKCGHDQMDKAGAHFPPEEVLLVVATLERGRARELVRRALSDGRAPGREKRSVQDRDAD
eukprot:2876393-Pleurochrysis_carterae.AAC.2